MRLSAARTGPRDRARRQGHRRDRERLGGAPPHRLHADRDVACSGRAKPGELEPDARASFKQKRKAGREVERAQQHAMRSPARAGDGKVRLGVSHRGLKSRKKR